MPVTTTRKIGALDVSVAGLGCNNFGSRMDEDAATAVVAAALDAGITHFDTADLYGATLSEEFLGRALGARRDDVIVATKFGMMAPPNGLTGGHPDWVASAADDSLRRLGTDRIDLYWLHAPDAATPIGDTLEALDRLVTAGKVREIGCSNFTAAQLDEAATVAAERGLRRFVTVQNEYSVIHREPESEVLPACARLDMSLVPYFPLASGLLTGKYRRGEAPPSGTRLAVWPKERVESILADEKLAVVERLAVYATDHGHTLPELAVEQPARLERDRGRDLPGPGAAERGRDDRVAAHRLRAGRDRRPRRQPLTRLPPRSLLSARGTPRGVLRRRRTR
jgi:aryl-alcohol dehydrogenase-like predicted oxidoreductase